MRNDAFHKHRIQQRVHKQTTKLVKQYGISFLADLEQLSTNPFTTLGMVGKKHSITREAVRQTFNKLFHPYSYGKYNELKRDKLKKEIESMSCKYDPRHKTPDQKTLVGRGTIAEIAVINKCVELGYKVKFGTKGRIVDMEINGFLVDVKMCSTPTRMSGLTYYYSWSVKPGQVMLCRFFICHAKDIDTFFIIPNTLTNNNKTKSIYHRETTPQGIYANRKSRVGVDQSKYKEAWHLLAIHPD